MAAYSCYLCEIKSFYVEKMSFLYAFDKDATVKRKMRLFSFCLRSFMYILLSVFLILLCFLGEATKKQSVFFANDSS